MGFDTDTKHSTSTSIFSNIVSAATGSFTESLTISGTAVTGRELYTLIRDEKSTGTPGGTFTSGAWRTRDLNTKVTDEIGITLAENQFTLLAGTYRVFASAPGRICDSHRLRLQNITDVSTALLGGNSLSSPSDFTIDKALILGQFTINASKVFELQHRCFTTSATTGLGGNSGFGSDVEVYASIELWKIA